MLEIQSRIRVHAWCLNEGLELITRVSGCSFDSEDALDRLLAQNGVSKSVCNMRELLIITPINLILVTSVVVVV